MVIANKARNDIEIILDEKEYRIYDDSPRSIFEIWWEKAKEWIANLLEKLFPSIESTKGAAEPILIAIIVIVIILLVLAAFFIVRNSRRNRKFRDQIPLHSTKEMNWSFHMHLSEAMKHENSEDYSLATRHMFLALLLYFHEKQWLEARIWKTNWEYYDELRKVNQKWAEQFYHLALLFDEVTYGERIVKNEEYSEFRTEAMQWLKKWKE